MLSLFGQEARRILKKHPVNRALEAQGKRSANAILTRGAGRVHRLLPLEHAGMPLRLTCISGDPITLALAEWLGAEVVIGEGMTGEPDTALDVKFEAAAAALARSDLVILHLKGADVAARARRPEEKVRFLEKIDRHLAEFLESYEGPLRIAVASDHATLSETGEDVADPLPVVLWGEGIPADDVERFDEMSVSEGELQRFPLQLLLGKLFDLT